MNMYTCGPVAFDRYDYVLGWKVGVRHNINSSTYNLDMNKAIYLGKYN